MILFKLELDISKAAIVMLIATKIKPNILLKSLIYIVFFLQTPTFGQTEGEDTTQSDWPLISNIDGGVFDYHIWDRYVRRFRRDHHLAATAFWEKGTWHVGSFGRISERDFPATGVRASMQYTFHIQLSGKFGYYLGSGAGYYFEMLDRGDNDFGPSSMWNLPGIVGGLVYNYDPTGCFYLGAEGYLSRIMQLSTRDTEGESQTISVTGETFEFHGGWDRFISLNWGMRVQYSRKSTWVPVPRDAADSPVDARIRHQSQGFALGGVYHFL